MAAKSSTEVSHSCLRESAVGLGGHCTTAEVRPTLPPTASEHLGIHPPHPTPTFIISASLCSTAGSCPEWPPFSFPFLPSPSLTHPTPRNLGTYQTFSFCPNMKLLLRWVMARSTAYPSAISTMAAPGLLFMNFTLGRTTMVSTTAQLTGTQLLPLPS